MYTNSNLEYWNQQDVDVFRLDPDQKYGVVVDLKGTDQILQAHVNPNALIIMAAQKTTPTVFDFGDWLWNNVTIKMPSPRAETFHDAMKLATRLIAHGVIELDNTWTKGYNRSNQWQQAFTDANNRPENYQRGYIIWD